MQIYVKEWPNRAATLYSDMGEELWTFASIDSALARCLDVTAALGDLPDRGDVGMLRALFDARSAA